MDVQYYFSDTLTEEDKDVLSHLSIAELLSTVTFIRSTGTLVVRRKETDIDKLVSLLNPKRIVWECK